MAAEHTGFSCHLARYRADEGCSAVWQSPGARQLAGRALRLCLHPMQVALVGGAPVILLDEPSTGMDPGRCAVPCLRESGGICQGRYRATLAPLLLLLPPLLLPPLLLPPLLLPPPSLLPPPPPLLLAPASFVSARIA